MPFKQFWNILKHSIRAEWITSSPHCVQLQSIRMREESWVGGIAQKTAQPAFKIYPRKETSQQKSCFSFINKEIARTLGVFIWSKNRPGKMVEDQPRRGAQMWFRTKTPRNQASLERPWCYHGHTWPAPHGWELDLPDLPFPTSVFSGTLEYLLFSDLVYCQKIWNKLHALWHQKQIGLGILSIWSPFSAGRKPCFVPTGLGVSSYTHLCWLRIVMVKTL